MKIVFHLPRSKNPKTITPQAATPRKVWPREAAIPFSRGILRQLLWTEDARQSKNHNSPGGDTKKGMAARRQELLRQLLWTEDARPAVVVGHSHFFRSFVRDLLDASNSNAGGDSKGGAGAFERANPELCADLRNKKLCNCGMLRLDLELSQKVDPNTSANAEKTSYPTCQVVLAALCVGSKLGSGQMESLVGGSGSQSSAPKSSPVVGGEGARGAAEPPSETVSGTIPAATE